ncbi:MAG: UDP-N-acetyl-D-glucosamine dehydrogenase [Chloroflexi bacterium]|nr:UDP-N-acetyl-D-glucosamine dehydrogenase [Chloroflexota bacterium]
MSYNSVIKKIKDHSAVVGVVGLGYVGLPFAVEKGKVGFTVIGFDMDLDKVNQINKGVNYIPDVKDAELSRLVKTKKIMATNNFDKLSDVDIIVIAVPTPLKKNLIPDLSYVKSATNLIAKNLKRGHLVSLESTTYPGTTEEVMLPILEKSGLKADQDFYLSYSPERVDPGNLRYTTKNTNKVVGGVGKKSLNVAKTFYGETIDHVVPVSSAKIAEMVKVYENTYRAVNIALVNEMTLLCDRMEINVWEMSDAAFTKPFGISPFYPGPGVGGHCIPLDPHYLEWKAREYDFKTRFIELAGDINRSMPQFVYQKIIRLLNHNKKILSSAKILIIGMAYKSNLPDYRESPSLEIFKLLYNECKMIEYHDDYVESINLEKKTFFSTDLTKLGLYDLIVIATDHSYVNYKKVLKEAQLILDTRNATKKLANKGNVVLL